MFLSATKTQAAEVPCWRQYDEAAHFISPSQWCETQMELNDTKCTAFWFCKCRCVSSQYHNIWVRVEWLQSTINLVNGEHVHCVVHGQNVTLREASTVNNWDEIMRLNCIRSHSSSDILHTSRDFGFSGYFSRTLQHCTQLAVNKLLIRSQTEIPVTAGRYRIPTRLSCMENLLGKKLFRRRQTS